MKAKLIDKTALAGVVGGLAAKMPVYAPVRDGRRVYFRFLAAEDEACLDYGNSDNAPKNLFFPHTETLMRFTRTARGHELVEDEAANQDQEMVLFGVRPCDVRSFTLLDYVFDQEKYTDPYYVERRKRTVIVALACLQPPASTCFCTSVGGHPAQADGADIMITEVGEQYLVEFLSEKGEKLAEFFGQLPEADAKTLARKEELVENAVAAIKTEIPGAMIKDWLDKNFEHPFWDQIHQSCLGCGTCTYLCPTCHCFDIRDELEGDQGIRLRTWDTCMYALYTQETSGHNPRPSQKQRWRQRLMHKFKYFVDNFREISCVGCGRCVINCPVNIDIRKLVSDIGRLMEAEEESNG
ncbi:MAG: 4Fe-4S ferredoxin [Deltaproteobacteria bacterium]|nr:4Fe-4S ferredoxin [Deltaproteobacteria bacterium]